MYSFVTTGLYTTRRKGIWRSLTYISKTTAPWRKVIVFPHLSAREAGKYGVSLASPCLAILNNKGKQVF